MAGAVTERLRRREYKELVGDLHFLGAMLFVAWGCFGRESWVRATPLTESTATKLDACPGVGLTALSSRPEDRLRWCRPHPGEPLLRTVSR